MGIDTMISKLSLAFQGLYRGRGYREHDFDLALLIFRIGGRQLLRVLSSEIGLPSLRRLRSTMSFVKVHPTLGRPDERTIIDNLNDVVIPTRRTHLDSVSAPTGPARRGARLLVDEIAIEERAVYLKGLNSVGGLCWVHTFAEDLILDSWDRVTEIATRLARKQYHLGKEMTVVVISVLGERTVYPILVAATCKKDDANHAEMIFRLVTEAYMKHGYHILIAPLWAWLTDGDGKRRSGGHRYFLSIQLEADSRLFNKLGYLRGFNIMVGPYEITIGFDWRHIDKRKVLHRQEHYRC